MISNLVKCFFCLFFVLSSYHAYPQMSDDKILPLYKYKKGIPICLGTYIDELVRLEFDDETSEADINQFREEKENFYLNIIKESKKQIHKYKKEIAFSFDERVETWYRRETLNLASILLISKELSFDDLDGFLVARQSRFEDVQNNKRLQAKARKKEYSQKYYQRPGVQTRIKEYYANPDVKERVKKRREEPEFKAYTKKYFQQYRERPDVKKRVQEHKKAYEARSDVKARRKEKNARQDVKARRKAYKAQPDVKARRRAYQARPDVKARRKEKNARRKAFLLEQLNNLSKEKIQQLLDVAQEAETPCQLDPLTLAVEDCAEQLLSLYEKALPRTPFHGLFQEAVYDPNEDVSSEGSFDESEEADLSQEDEEDTDNSEMGYNLEEEFDLVGQKRPRGNMDEEQMPSLKRMKI